MRGQVLLFVIAAAQSASAQRWIDVSPGPRGFGPTTYADEFGAFVTYDGSPKGTTWLHHGSDWRPVPTADRPPSLAGHALAYDAARGEVLLFGGTLPAPARVSNETWRFDGRDWRRFAPLASPEPRTDHRMTFHGATGTVVLFGGTDLATSSGAWLPGTWTWDGANWTRRHPLLEPSPCAGHAMAYDPVRGRTVLVGRASALLLNAELWEWDGTVWHAQPQGSPRPLARRDAAMTYDPVAGACLLHGGRANRQLRDSWHWNGSSWAPAPPLPAGVDGSWLATAADGRMLLTGGGRPWLHDGSGWRAASAAPPPRYSSAFAYDASRGVTLQFGGIESGAFADTTLAFDGFTWRDVSGSTRPPARHSTALVTDTARDRVVMFCGRVSAHADTWEWNGNWRRRFPATSPPWRYGHALAYDERRARVVMFGGSEAFDFATTTWEWDGQDWALRAAGQRPAGRAGHAMAYDASRCTTVAFGGRGRDGPLRDTWEWDGADWARVASRETPQHPHTALVFDGSRGRLQLLGGAAIWELAREGWTRRFTAEPPVAIENNVVLDGARGELLLHEGNATFRWSDFAPEVSGFGTGCGTATAPEPVLLFLGRPAPGNPATAWRLERLAPSLLLALAVDTARNALPPDACFGWLPSPAVAALGASGNGGGRELAAPVPANAALRGVTLHAQAFVLAANGSFAVSPGVTVRVGS